MLCIFIKCTTKILRRQYCIWVTGMSDLINALYNKALSVVLRSTLLFRSAWYDSNQVSDHVLEGYTKPLKVKGWDRALVEYTVAMLTDSASKPKPSLAKRLTEISCPVLIVTGDTDRLVPSWNSVRFRGPFQDLALK
ncbi:hypothetical protein BUALT_Bualt06G0060500 [Buddleja alternifolia]|uniref:Uncharacterized protein n=1 Tax=Buddleja alternifolia TaxID=168488 RepID=A0AAV6XCP4_9LAMI|nr:hypothetical protein BUALT_Bualt06G0060500 [Buddleja alternifolia]